VAAVLVADEAVVDREEVVLIALTRDRAARISPDVSTALTFMVGADGGVESVIEDRHVSAGYPGSIQWERVTDAVVRCIGSY
jgi:hypothetical protein